MAEGLFDFFSRARGQERRKASFLPVPTCFYGVDCADIDAENAGKFRKSAPVFDQHPYHQDMLFVKNRPSIHRTFVCSVLNGVVNIFIQRSVAKVVSGVVVAVSVHVPNDISIWPWPVKRLCHNAMDSFGRLTLVLRSFFEGYRQIRGCAVRLSDKAFPTLHGGNAPKAADFVSVVSNYWQPNLRGVRHG